MNNIPYYNQIMDDEKFSKIVELTLNNIKNKKHDIQSLMNIYTNTLNHKKISESQRVEIVKEILDKVKGDFPAQYYKINKIININKKKIKEVQGGAPGLLQQKIKDYPKFNKVDYVYPEIKNSVKSLSKVDIVFIGAGIGYCTVEEDAELLHKKYGHQYVNKFDNHPYYETRCGKMYIDALIKKIEKEGLNYALLEIIRYEKPVLREIIKASDRKLIGKQF